MSDLKHILNNNVDWARGKISQDPEYFSRLAKLQTPKILWIGCADSRVPADTITGLQPGEIFVHRNVANLVYGADLNCMSVLQYAVEVLKVEHIIVCGHYGCGGVRTAFKGEGEGLIDHWLEPIKQLTRQHKSQLDALPDETSCIDYLCEQNVRSQLLNVAQSPIVERARANGQDLTLHGWIYGLADGLLRDLEINELNQPD